MHSFVALDELLLIKLDSLQHCFADVSLKYKYGRLVLEVPLPSRNEKCLFFLRPMLMNVGDLIADLQREDPGAKASVLSKGKMQCVWYAKLRKQYV